MPNEPRDTENNTAPAAAPSTDKPAKRAPRSKAKPTATFAACMKAAQEQIKNVPKNGTNKFHHYDYTTAEDMIAACRHALHSNDLVAERTGWSLRFEDAVHTSSAKTGAAVVTPCCVVVSRMRITHVPTDEMHEDHTEYPALPEKGRPLDKAISGALSTSLSYWWRDTLQVPRCDYEVDIGQSGQVDDTPGPARQSEPRRTQQRSSGRGGATGSRTPNGGERIVAHYTQKLRAAISRGPDAVTAVAAQLRASGDVAKGSDESLRLRDEFDRCLQSANAPPVNDDRAERDAIANEGGNENGGSW